MSARTKAPNLRAGSPRSNDLPHAHPLPPSHFTLREDGSVVPTPDVRSQKSEVSPPTSDLRPLTSVLPRLAFSDPARGIWLYHGNCLELLDAIAAKYPDGWFDAIFADPPYFLSNGGITCHAGESHFRHPQLALTA